MPHVFILDWVPNTQFTVKAGVFSSIEKVIAHLKKSIYKSDFNEAEIENIEKCFIDGKYLYETKLIKIEFYYVN